MFVQRRPRLQALRRTARGRESAAAAGNPAEGRTARPFGGFAAMTQPDWADQPNPTAPATGSATTQAREIAHDLYCQECGYNLRGLISNRCPECGWFLETVRATESQIPWVHRKKLAWFRAY